jgi:hypothetical protein
MKFFNIFWISFLFILHTQCNPASKIQVTQSRKPLKYNETVQVITKPDQLPADAEKIGNIRVGDSGFSTNCNLEKVLDDAKIEARKVGGNILLITRHKTPDMWSSCHRISADIYFSENKSYAFTHE